MANPKNYVIDTNVLLEDPGSLLKLRNGSENNVFIPYHVLMELSKFKKDPKLGYIVSKVVRILSENPDNFSVLNTNGVAESFSGNVDNYILDEIVESGISEPILVTNDKIFQLQAGLKGVRSEAYKESMPFKTEAEYYTGFVEAGRGEGRKQLHVERPWKARLLGSQRRKDHRLPAQDLERGPAKHLPEPGAGAYDAPGDRHRLHTERSGLRQKLPRPGGALFLTQEKKTHQKIYVIKPMIEIGKKLGYLPGSITEKMEPYTKYIEDLVLKLHRMRPARKIFVEDGNASAHLDPKRFELLPLAYIRGMNIENSVVIIDEMQNLSRMECRALLSRMGEGVKCFCLGDIRQVDNPYLSTENNGLNWIVKKFKGSKIYAHIVLKGEKSRGPITDLVINSGL